ncbi:MAG: hypothetical protein QGI21_04680 [Candidatus Poseidoniaceae archaeon]|nr:hypothetical protein [Candidatus Poseidoniaceae archaeon]
MAGERKEYRPSAAECLVNATLTVMDRIMIHDHLDRASAETSKHLNSVQYKYVT